MDMTTLTIDIGDFESIKARLCSGKPDSTPRYTFPSAEAMARTLTPGRWGLLAALTGSGCMGVRELARRVGRDVRAVHADAQALVLCGLVDKSEDGKLHFPYNTVHVDFTLKEAA